MAKLNDIIARLKELKLEAGTRAEEKAREEKKNDNDINKAMVDAMNKFNGRFKTVNQYKAELLAYQAIADDDKDAFKKQIGKRPSPANAGPTPPENRRRKRGGETCRQSAKSTGQVQPLANYADVLGSPARKRSHRAVQETA